MTKTIELARKAKIKNDCDGVWGTADQFEHFAGLVRADEREECAKLADPSEEQKLNPQDFVGEEAGIVLCEILAATIRARGES